MNPLFAQAPQGVVEQAKKLLAKGKAAEAEAILDKFTRTELASPEIVSAKVLLFRAQAAQNKREEARAGFEQILLRYPKAPEIPEVYEALVKIHEAKLSPATADEVRNKLIALYPAHPATLRVCLLKIEAAFRAGNYREVVRLLAPHEKSLTSEQAAQLLLARSSLARPGDVSGLLKEAAQLMSTNQTAKAKVLLEAFLKQPGSVAAHSEAKVRMGWCLYLEAGKANGDAAEKLWLNVARDASAPEVWRAEADWHLVQLAAGPRGDWQSAVRLCDDIVRKRPKGSFAQEQALFSKAWLLTMHKQWKPALEAFAQFEAAFPQATTHLPVQRYRDMASDGLAKNGKVSR